MTVKTPLLWTLLCLPLGLGAATPTGSPTPLPTLTIHISATPTLTCTGTRTATPSITPSATPSATPSPAFMGSPTVTPTGTVSPDWLATLAADSRTPTPSMVVTQATTATPDLTATPSPVLGASSPTPTATMSATPIGGATPVLSATVIASFEGSDPVTPVAVCAQGGTIVLTVVPGCPYGSSGAACHATGSCPGTGGNDSQLFLSVTAGASDASAAESAARRVTFHVLASSLPSGVLKVTVNTLYGDFSADVSVTAVGLWTDITVSLPDDQAAGSLPQLQPDPLNPPTQPWAQAIKACTGISIQPVAAGAFDFTVDDVQWGTAATGASPSQVAAGLGVSLADVQEAYTFGLGDQATWILLILSKHCGCHPHTVLALRGTLSWGQIAVQEGSTWTAVLAELDGAEAAAGLVPDPPTADETWRVLQNGPPSTTPLPSPTPYAPTGPFVLPPAGAC